MSNNERIWAPWRLAYVQSADEPQSSPASDSLQFLPDADPGCFICQAVADQNGSADRERLVVERTERTITILNRYPYNNGHLLIAPLIHQGRLDELPDETHTELMTQMSRWIQVYEKLLNPDGFNAGLNLGRVAGAGLPGHLHWHVVPRWNGDTNFMPALAGVKVIPQSLDALWEMLTEELAGQ